MKPIATKLLSTMVLLFLTVLAASAQAPPGWGWINKLGTFVPNTVDGSSVAGLGRDAAGNLYLLGTYVGAPLLGGVPTTNAGETDVFLAKYDPAGALLWLRLLQSAGVDQATALTVEPSGRCTIAGRFGKGPTGSNLAFTGFGATTPLGGPALYSLATTPLGYESIPFIASIDAAGLLLWADVPSPTYGVSIASLQRDAVGNCYVSANMNPLSQSVVNGQSYPAIGSYDAVLIKYTAAGQPAWARRVGASAGFTYTGKVKTDAANAVYWSISHNRTLTLDGRNVPFVTSANPVVQGSNTLVKLDANNVVRWTKNSLLKSGAANAQVEVLYIDATTNVMYLSGGSYGGTVTNPESTVSLAVPAGSYGTCIARCDTSGAVQWLRPFAYASTVPNGARWAAAAPLDFFPDAAGYTALTNTAYAGQTLFPPSTTFDFSRNGLPCVVHYTYATDSFDWARTGGVVGSYPGTAQGSSAVAVAVDAAGNAYVTGNFTGTAQFGALAVSTTYPTQQEIFLAKLDQSVLTGTRAAAGQAWSVFPNPTIGAVQLTGLPSQAHVRAYDAQGRAVRELTVTGSAAWLAGLAPSLYLLQVSNTAKPFRPQRLLVQ